MVQTVCISPPSFSILFHYYYFLYSPAHSPHHIRDLDPNLPTIGQPTGAEITGGRSADVLVKDYLTSLLNHLASTLGLQTLSTSRFSFVVTVPAIWSEEAKTAITTAFRSVLSSPPWPSSSSTSSGPTSAIHIISEPEAAALASLSNNKEPPTLKKNDTVVVVDAGGGTVDAISYTIANLHPLELVEAAPGCGAICGSAFVNMRFGKYAKLKFGEHPGFTDGVFAEAMDYFERVAKRGLEVNTPPATTYPVPMPLGDDEEARRLGVVDGVYSLGVSELKTLFEPVVLETIKLVKEQVAATKSGPVSAVLLVGGFAASTYLFERVKIALGNGVEVLRPEDGWSAVARGAVMRGLEIAKKEQLGEDEEEEEEEEEEGVRARVSYGVESEVVFDEKMHGDVRERRYWCAREGRYKIRVMNWFLKRVSSSFLPLVDPRLLY